MKLIHNIKQKENKKANKTNLNKKIQVKEVKNII